MIIMVSLSPLATNVGWMIAANRANPDGSGIPQRANASSCAPRVPKALVITAEADVLRDEGEAYSRKLREAGVDVAATRYEGIIHDFVMINDLRHTNAADAAIRQSIEYLREALH